MSLSFRTMFIGHFGLGFAAKRAAPSASLGALFTACQFADLLWPVLVLAGREQVEVQPGATAFTPLNFISYPYSHSLVALCGWGVAFAAAYAVARRARMTTAITIALLVVSHWVLDVITHRPDMPVTVGGAERLGFGLWNSIPATLVVEAIIFAVGLTLYLRETAARDRIGSVGLWTLVGFLLIVYLAAAFGPPPPSGAAAAGSATAMWIIVAWGYWVDNHRRSTDG
jgi:hypothetical protein